MADRIALAIEPDTDTANQIRTLLEPKGFRVESIPNGDDAMEWGRTNKPAVIILSVEPRKVGYAISNKLRRSPSLREVPLVLISAEETLATFEQHKKLKSRADQYLLKPLDMQDLLSKVDGLVGLGSQEAPPEGDADDDDIQEIDADSDLVIADDDDIAIVSSADEDAQLAGLGRSDDDEGIPATPAPRVQDVTAEQHIPGGENGASPFEGERF